MLGKTLGGADGPTLGKYDDTYLGSSEGFTDGTADGKFDRLLLGSRLGLVDVLKLGTDKVTELVFWGGKLIGITLLSILTWCI